MGQGYEFKCKCSYSFSPSLGVGFLFPKEYQELKESARKGKLGKKLKSFFAVHPEGGIDAEKVVARCKKCGRYKCVPDLSMYLPTTNEKKPKGIWSTAMPFEGADYVSPRELKESYELYARYPHKCRWCRGELEIISEEDLVKNGIVCPKCGRIIPCDEANIYYWD